MFLRPTSGRAVVDMIPFFEDGWFHVFYLSPIDISRRARCSWEHLRSRDLVTWEELPAALEPEDGYIDRDAVWTGSVVRIGDRYHLYYTALNTSDPVQQQRIALAVSDDLVHFEKVRDFEPPAPTAAGWDRDNFRDPYVEPTQAGYRMLISTRRSDVGHDRSGFVAQSHSVDGRSWSEPELFYDGCDTFCPECVDIRALGDTSIMGYATFTDRKRTVFRTAPSDNGAWSVALNGEPDGAWWYAAKSTTDAGSRVISFGWVSDGISQATRDFHFGGDMALPREMWLVGPRELGWRIPDEVRAAFDAPVPLEIRAGHPTEPPVTLDAQHATIHAEVMGAEPEEPTLTEFRLDVTGNGTVALHLDGDAGLVFVLDASTGTATLTPARAANKGGEYREVIAAHGFDVSAPVLLQLVRRRDVVEFCLNERSWFTARTAASRSLRIITTGVELKMAVERHSAGATR